MATLKKPTDRELRLRKAKKFLNKHFKQSWGVKWKSSDAEVKTLANILKSKSEVENNNKKLDCLHNWEFHCLECHGEGRTMERCNKCQRLRERPSNKEQTKELCDNLGHNADIIMSGVCSNCGDTQETKK